MNQKFLKLVCLNILIALSICPALNAKALTTKDPIFVFHNDEFWLNLHHFLYVLGRAENKERDTAREAVAGAPADQASGLTKLSAKEQKIWREAVASYATGPSKNDIVFDDPMPAITAALARAGDSKSLGSEIDPAIATILQRAAPIYRKAWWRKHHEANQHWQKSIDKLVALHGANILAFITKAYKLEWPTAGFPVHVTGYSNWAGAYSTTGNLLVVASQSPSLQGLYGLETIFHEGMHQWDDQVFAAMREQATKLNKFFPRGLTHSLIFFTAGEAVRRTLDGARKSATSERTGAVGGERGGTVEPGYVPYAEKFGVWQRGMGPFKVPLEEIWKPYLDGRGTRDEAFVKLIERTAIEPPEKAP
ncbi:MAG TPA: hypothetical protein VFR80_01110 [Pyrinomonadaceae bacterium]|nr:hypothetical protein [Pyrinomonadaceae bacterium]